MVIKLLKNPFFLIGSFFIFSLFISSIIYNLFWDDYIPIIDVIYNESGQPDKSPFSPFEYPPLGTDPYGRNIFFIMLVGAKYTIGAAIIIALLRVIISTLIGVLSGVYFPTSNKKLSMIIDASNFFPVAIFVYFLMKYLMLDDYLLDETFTFSFNERVLFGLFIFTVIAIPSVSTLISKETERILKNDFVECSIVMGANKLHLITKHVNLFLIPQLFVIFVREFIQVMLLIAHLGILGIFIGGGKPAQDLFNNHSIISLSNEWSGLIGSWWSYMWTTYPWIAFIPILFFTLTIFAAKAILEGLKVVTLGDYSEVPLKKVKTNLKTPTVSNEINKADFTKVQI